MALISICREFHKDIEEWKKIFCKVLIYSEVRCNLADFVLKLYPKLEAIV